jgi:hypothetical protein
MIWKVYLKMLNLTNTLFLDECGNYEFLDTDTWEVIIEKAND